MICGGDPERRRHMNFASLKHVAWLPLVHAGENGSIIVSAGYWFQKILNLKAQGNARTMSPGYQHEMYIF